MFFSNRKKEMEQSMDYQNADLFRIAKRESNQKREYLVVNRLQGKHIPVKPGQALAMFRALAGRLPDCCEGERTLVIGFAETATAIGAAVALERGCRYMQTTRETIPGVEYLYFSEEHSHATQQRLVKNDLDRILPEIDRIVFAEDEVTTGNTICNLIRVLEQAYLQLREYLVASLLNGMDAQALQQYHEKGIGVFYLVKTDHSGYTQAVQGYSRAGRYINKETVEHTGCGDEPKVREREIGGWLDARRLVQADAYKQACIRLWKELEKCLDQKPEAKVLVLGTEEFMYPALFAAEQMEGCGADVRFHATTRSPIAVFAEDAYPLHIRYELPGIYDAHRRTFLYDLAVYDAAVVITDAHAKNRSGVDALLRALTPLVKNIDAIWGR